MPIKKIIIINCLLSFFILLSMVDITFAARRKEAKKASEQKDSDQQILGFNMAGFGDKGKKTWEIKGSSADIFVDIVKLTDINANFYGKDETMNLTAKNGFYDKTKNLIHLENDVVATTLSGMKFNSNSLDWDRDNQRITTSDIATIHKENIEAIGKGMDAQTNVKKVYLKENVTVTIKPADPGSPDTIITCDGPLEIDYEKQTAIFNRNVKVDDRGGRGIMYSDRMEITFDYKTKKVNTIVATERPRVFIFSTEGLGGLLSSPTAK